MNMQQLHCFIVSADKLNFTKAAEILSLSTPTVTHHIKSLEKELGAILFERSPKNVKLTHKGELFYEYAKDMLEKERLAKRQMAELENPGLDFIIIGCTSVTELGFIKNVLAEFRKEYPNLYPRITVGNYFQASTLFRNGQIDLFFATREMVQNNPDCTFRKLFQDRDYALIPKDSPLYGMDEISFCQMEDEVLVTLDHKLVPHNLRSNVKDVLASHANRHFDIICESEVEGILLAESGYGITILPGYMIPESTMQAHVARIREADTLDYGIAYNQGSDIPGLRRLIQIARKQASSV